MADHPPGAEDTTARRLVCIHGHFYQPPRENPWSGVIEAEASAHPYHDWNERITDECYAPNLDAPILDDSGTILRRVDNFSRISFDVGPTLLSWLERHRPAVYEGIVEADRTARGRFGGSGAAMAQPYYHLIMPLAGTDHLRLQVDWGIADFQKRFGRDPEGIWLPETAISTESLAVVAEAGIGFTVVAPHQLATETDTPIDSGAAYRVDLPSGRTIVVFAYDAEIASAVAFGDLLTDGRRLADRLIDRAGCAHPPRQRVLAHFATDGETFGHHHRQGEMALAACLDRIESSSDATLINYSAYLAANPADIRARIVDDTSWSCFHGVERWRSGCSCTTGGDGAGATEWRAPLREGVESVRIAVESAWSRFAAQLFSDPDRARRRYIVEDRRDRPQADQLLDDNLIRPQSRGDRRRALMLLEAFRCCALSQTSCGWFFDDVDRIESRLVIGHAGRAAELLDCLQSPIESDTDTEDRQSAVARLSSILVDSTSGHSNTNGAAILDEIRDDRDPCGDPAR